MSKTEGGATPEQDLEQSTEFDDLYDDLDDDSFDGSDAGSGLQMDLGDDDDEDDKEPVKPNDRPAGTDNGDDMTEADRQRERSWEGRLRAKEAALAAKEREIEEKAKKGPATDTPKADDKELTQDEKETIKGMSAEERAEFEKEFPDVKQYMDTVVRESEQKVTQKVDPLIKGQEKSALDLHFQTLADAHSDYQKVATSDDMLLFIEEAPAYARDGMRRVLAKGTAQECIELLDNYKQARGLSKRPANGAKGNPIPGGRPARREEVAVRAGGRTHVPPSRMGGDEDFDSLYDRISDEDLD